MSDFSEELDAFATKLEGLANLSLADKEEISKAGAKVYEKELTRVTRQRHFRFIKTNKSPHLAENIGIKVGNRSGERKGSYTVGWGHETAYIANFIENGTRVPLIKTVPGSRKKGRKTNYRTSKGGQVAIRADHFIRDVQKNNQVNRDMLEAMNKVYLEKAGVMK